MRVIERRNVNHMLSAGLSLLSKEGQRSASRAGDVIVAPYPVMSVYERPTERVLMSVRRDANPFFHLYECMWMLAGRNEVQSLQRYIKDFDRFADDGVIHGAYGHRWRVALGFDQLDEVVQRLRVNGNDRQCVIQMWDTNPIHGVIEDYKNVGIKKGDGEIEAGHDDLRGVWKDRPCNTHIYLRVHGGVLDLTVCCRSNDIVWGAYGANAVHFSFLQEYLAGRIGVGVGRMYQFSNNYHGYVDVLDKLGSPSQVVDSDPYGQDNVVPMPIGDKWEHWDSDLRMFMEWHDKNDALADYGAPYKNSWFHAVAVPMVQAHWTWKNKLKAGSVHAALTRVRAPDWQEAAVEWMIRRNAL